MFSKTWNEMREIDVLPFCDSREAKDDSGKKVQIPYLNWAKCVDLLHQNGAEVVMFEPLVNADGSTLFHSEQEFKDKYEVTHRCYEVRVKITIDDIEFVQNYPLLNGVLPVRDNSISQLRISNAHARAFVKGVAIRTGLGFGLWLTNDETSAKPDQGESYADQDVMKYKKKLGELISVKLQGGADVMGALGLETMDDLRAEVRACDRLAAIERTVMAL